MAISTRRPRGRFGESHVRSRREVGASAEKVLVTGSRGFIGGHLVRALRDCNVDVAEIRNRVDCDLRDVPQLRARIEASAPDVVIHLAATPDSGAHHPHSLGDQANTVASTVNVLRVIQEVCPEALLIHVGSYKQYGNVPVPFTEAGPVRPANDYGFAKQMSEALATTVSGTAVDAVCLRLGPVFGPGQAADRLIPRLITLLSERVEQVPVADVPWDPLYITDAVEAICLAMSAREARGTTLNISGGVATSPYKIALMIGELLEAPVAKRVVSWEGASFACIGDIGAAETVLGWKPSVPLRDGLEFVTRDLDHCPGTTDAFTR